MKAIIVIDMPEVCTDCPMHKFHDIDNWDDPSGYCILGTETIDNVFQTKPSWCPLKPLPQMKFYAGVNSDFVKGWSACLKEIEK